MHIFINVLPPGGARFSTFNITDFERSVIVPLHRALDEQGLANLIGRVVVFAHDEEECEEVIDDPTPHTFTPTTKAVLTCRGRLTVYLEEWLLRRYHGDTEERLEGNAIRYSRLQGATGIIVWYPDRAELTTQELVRHVMYHIDTPSLEVTTIGVPIPETAEVA